MLCIVEVAELVSQAVQELLALCLRTILAVFWPHFVLR
jgi:hypothetical protein